MPDARAAARTWLAEIHRAADCPHAYNPCADCLADAILSAPGVQVQREQVSFRQAQVVIRLPAQPIGDGRG